MTDPVYSSTPEEDRDFKRLVEGLPETKIGLGAHSLEAVRSILKIVRPERILEIGFDRGHSAAMWLGLSDASVVSVDISDDPELLRAVEILQERYPGRLTFIHGDSRTVRELLAPHAFDLVFIDGDHSEEGALADLLLAFELEAPWIAFDDWLPRFGPGVQKAALRAGFVPITVFKANIALGRGNL